MPASRSPHEARLGRVVQEATDVTVGEIERLVKAKVIEVGK
jgi:hypothetical protein